MGCEALIFNSTKNVPPQAPSASRARECSKVSNYVYVFLSLSLSGASRFCVREIAWAAWVIAARNTPRLSDIHNKHERHRCLRPSIFRGYYPCDGVIDFCDTHRYVDARVRRINASRETRVRQFSEATTRSDIVVIQRSRIKRQLADVRDTRCQKYIYNPHRDLIYNILPPKYTFLNIYLLDVFIDRIFKISISKIGPELQHHLRIMVAYCINRNKA